ncbi:hypothetical protein K461DRAFT_216333, partial [Myriangium duriaei CBS 260.36]
PAGYTTSFTNALASISESSYLGYRQISSYNTTLCASICNGISGCNSFNIYFQRNPLYSTNANCINPPARTAIQCGFYGDYLSSSMATNVGNWQQSFEIVLAGSNAYNKNYVPSTVASFKGPNALTGWLGSSSDYLAYSYSTTYSPSACASACLTLTAERRAIAILWSILLGGSYTPCNSFNIFNLTINSVVQSYMCVLYSD